MDLRAELEHLLKNYGHNVFLQRCTNSLTPCNKPEYSLQLEKHTVRSMNAVASRALAGVQQEEVEGLSFPTEQVFWFRWDVNPAIKDRVYENIPRYPNDQVIYTVDFADAKRGKNGRIEFWVVGATKTYDYSQR